MPGRCTRLILHFHVAQRTHEAGIRLALGAHPGLLLRELLAHSAKLSLVAIVLGLLGAALATRLLRGLIIGVTPLDPLTFLAVGLLLALVAAVASWVPARRATRLDPVEALRAE